MMRRTLRTALSGALLTMLLSATGTVAIAAVVASPAAAQTGYPPGPCTTTASSQMAGTFAVGAVITVEINPVCAFTPGTIAAVEVNGVLVANKTVTLSGIVSVGVTVLSRTQLSIDDPVIVPAVCGTNTITGRGPSAAAGTMVTDTVMVNVDCGGTSAVRSSLLARTGAFIGRTAGIAAVLVALGAALAVPARRRRRRRAEDRVTQPVG